MKHNPYQTGMSLIEIMIALLIGAFLLGGVLQIFISSKQTYRMQENLSRLQENGRLALDLIGRDVRMTSYWGCLIRPSGDIAGSNDNAVNGDNIDNGTDTVTLKSVFAITAATTPLITPTVTCGQPVVPAISPATPSTPDAIAYADPTSTIIYSINNAVLRKNTNDLIEGVENMQILYGEDTPILSIYDGWANYYVPANNVVNWEKVVSIRVSLLIRSLEDNLAAQPLAYTYNGVTATPTDRRLRRVFTSTFAIRNRLP